MHMHISFVGAMGSIMEESELVEVMNAGFSGVAKMMNGKKCLQNVRALRIIVKELLRKIIQDNKVASYDELMLHLDDISGNNRTANLWVHIFIKSVFIMMLYIRTEREGDWPLHMEATKQMMPYVYASGHVNYARYGLFYPRSMEKLPVEIRGRFMKRELVIHHIPGLWNGLWSDMYIESTFKRYGHSHGGIIGITLQPETLKIWELHLHIWSRIVEDMTHMSDHHSVQTQETHKEESKSRIRADAADRKVIREKL